MSLRGSRKVSRGNSPLKNLLETIKKFVFSKADCFTFVHNDGFGKDGLQRAGGTQ